MSDTYGIIALFICGASIGFILYTYLGYPALLAILARLRPRPAAGAFHTPAVTLLIAAYNEADTIAHKLENSLALDYPAERLQILVAADGSDDGTAEIVAGYAQRDVLLNHDPERRGKMAAVNRALPRATGEIVVFSDANNLYDSDALRHLVAPFADPRVGGSGGAKIILQGDGPLGETEGLYWRYESFIKEQESRLHSCVGVAGEIFAMRRHLIEPPPASIINDDFYMAMRLLRRGCRLVYVPEARSRERVSPSAPDEVARRTRIVAGRYQALRHARRLLPWKRPLLIWQIASHKFARPLVPLAMVTAFVANLVASFQPWPLAWLLLLLQVLFYGTALLGSRVAPGGLIGKLVYLPTYLVNSNAAAILGLYRYLTRQQSPRWQRVPRRSMPAAGGEKQP